MENITRKYYFTKNTTKNDIKHLVKTSMKMIMESREYHLWLTYHGVCKIWCIPYSMSAICEAISYKLIAEDGYASTFEICSEFMNYLIRGHIGYIGASTKSEAANLDYLQLNMLERSDNITDDAVDTFVYRCISNTNSRLFVSNTGILHNKIKDFVSDEYKSSEAFKLRCKIENAARRVNRL